MADRIQTTEAAAPKRAVIWAAVSSEAQDEDDKVSLRNQEKNAREVCAREGWQIVDVLRVKHSRDYVDIHECAAAMRAEGYDAFDRLIRHWQDRDFDVLICRDPERFARTQALHAYVVEMTIDRCGALIYSLADGLIDRTRMRMFISMTGYKAAADLDRLVAGRKAAAVKMAESGILIASQAPISHKIIRNEKGRNIGTVINEANQPVIIRAAQLVIDGTDWAKVEKTLFDVYGFGNRARAWRRFMFYSLFYNPVFWGNSGIHYYCTPDGRAIANGAWAFDPSVNPPPPTRIFYGTIAPAIDGAIAEQLKAELRRRLQFAGRRDFKRSRPFSGLVYCDLCMFAMSYHGNKGYPGHKCTTRLLPHRPDCENRKYISEINLRAWFTVLINRLLKSADAPIDVWGEENPSAARNRIEAQVFDLKGRIRKLIESQSTAPYSVSSMYAEQIEQYGKQLEAAERELDILRRQSMDNTIKAREMALKRIEKDGLDALWALPGYEQNRELHRIMGDMRLFVKDGKVVRVGKFPNRGLRP